MTVAAVAVCPMAVTVTAVALRDGGVRGGCVRGGALRMPGCALSLSSRLLGLPAVRVNSLAVAGSWAVGPAAGVARLSRNRSRDGFGRSLRLPVRAGPGIGGHAPIIAKPGPRGALFITCVIPLAWWDHCTSRELRARG
jgi:hypothetical protein